MIKINQRVRLLRDLQAHLRTLAQPVVEMSRKVENVNYGN
jgi:hypothetical protein